MPPLSRGLEVRRQPEIAAVLVRKDRRAVRGRVGSADAARRPSRRVVLHRWSLVEPHGSRLWLFPPSDVRFAPCVCRIQCSARGGACHRGVRTDGAWSTSARSCRPGLLAHAVGLRARCFVEVQWPGISTADRIPMRLSVLGTGP
ncbi:MAG: hypothetical protein MZV70_64230 [Desulfobacterales bacterium]|nr:hypothetical protein [Desulfobacterales bacterium]